MTPFRRQAQARRRFTPASMAARLVASVAVIALAQLPAPPATAQGTARPGMSTARAPGYMGAQLLALTRELADDMKLGDVRGVVVNWIAPGLPAEQAGLATDDVILAADGAPVETAEALVTMLTSNGAGARVALKLLRAGEERTVTVTLAARPAEPRIPDDLLHLLETRNKLYEQVATEQSAQVHEAAQARLQALFGKRHVVTAQGLLQLGQVYVDLGRLEQAEKTLTSARDLFGQLVGPNHLKVSDAALSLGRVYTDLNRHEDAKREYLRALVIRERSVGRQHLDTAFVLYRLANLYEDHGDHAQAEPLARRALTIRRRHIGPDDSRLLPSLNLLGNVLYGLGRTKEAEDLHRRAAAISEQSQGPRNPGLAEILNNLANDLLDQSRFAEAKPLLERALQIREEQLGKEHPFVANTLNSLAILAENQGRYTDAEQLYLRSLSIRERKAGGPDHLDVADALSNLGTLYLHASRLAEAEPVLRRALEIYRRKLGAGHVRYASALHNLAETAGAQARYPEAEQMFQEALAIRARLLGPESADTSLSLASLASVLMKQGRYAEAEDGYRRVIEIREKVLGPDHPKLAQSLSDLAVLYARQQRHDETEALLKRSLGIAVAKLGPDHRTSLTSLFNLAGHYKTTRRFGEAKRLFEQALASLESQQGADQRVIGMVLDSLANVESDQGRYAEAEPLYLRALAIKEKTLGPDDPSVSLSVHNIAVLYRRQGRLDEAISFGQRRLASLERIYGADNPEIAESHWFLGHAYGMQNAWERSHAHFTQASDIWLRRGNRQEIAQAEHTFFGHVRAALNLAAHAPERAEELRHEAFAMAQWATQTGAATALAQMAARAAAGDGAVSTLVRERQDLAEQWTKADKALVATLSQPAEQRNSEFVGQLRGKLADLAGRSAALDGRLRSEFPQFAALALPQPIDVGSTQKLLRADEALVVFTWLEEAGYAFLITRERTRVVRLDRTYLQIYELSSVLLCGLDAAFQARYEADCRKGTGAEAKRDAAGNFRPETIPFNLVRAHELYRLLLGELEDEIRGKKLLITLPPGPLSRLPLGVLVTEAPRQAVPDDASGYRDAAWLGLRQSVTVLPSVAALKALREHAVTRRAEAPYIAFANPLLEGQPDDPEDRAAAALAKSWQRCADLPPAASERSRPVVASAPPVETVQRGVLGDGDAIRKVAPLPDTAEEVCRIGQQQGAADSAIHLGAHASEAAIKELSATGELARHRVLHLATHGILSGVFQGVAEPALILTPPATPSERDDGLLTASEVSTLKLNADWVVLSACNTAGADKSGEALSGLARAFFYAGARSLLVSHWEVYSSAAVEIITGAFEALKRDETLGRGEALRVAMRATVERGGFRAHPAYWAPFALVGEGAAQ